MEDRCKDNLKPLGGELEEIQRKSQVWLCSARLVYGYFFKPSLSSLGLGSPFAALFVALPHTVNSKHSEPPTVNNKHNKPQTVHSK